MGKGSNRRPGVIPDANWDAIFKPKPPECPVCKPDPCVCTEDGPGQEEAIMQEAVTEFIAPMKGYLQEVADELDKLKPEYDRRRFNREGV